MSISLSLRLFTRNFSLAVGLSFLALLVGCEREPRTDHRLTLTISSDPGTLDPAFAKDVDSGIIVGYIYGNLVRFDHEMNLVGDIAQGFSVDPDARTYRFPLSDNAFFASGQPVTAEDVRFSFERVLSPEVGSPRAWVLDRIRGAKEFIAGKADHVEGIRISGREIVLELETPFAPFLGLLTMPAAAIVEKVQVEALGKSFHEKAAGSGPFKLVRWQRDAELILELKAGAGSLVQGLDGVVIRILKEPLTLVSEFRLGNLDVIQVPSQAFATLWSDPRFANQHLSRPGLNFFYVGLNCESGPFSDRRVRRAAAMAIDRDRIIKLVREGQAVPAHGPIPPSLPGYDASYPGLSYDPDAARELLAEAKRPPGTKIRFLQGDRKANVEVTQLVKAFLERVGFEVELMTFEWNIFRKRVDRGAYDAFYLSWFADYADAENFLFPLFHSSRVGGAGNAPRYVSRQVDQWLEKALRTIDDAARVALYRSIERQVVEDASRIFLFHKSELWLHQPWISGYQLYPVFNGNRLDDVSVDASAFAVSPKPLSGTLVSP